MCGSCSTVNKTPYYTSGSCNAGSCLLNGSTITCDDFNQCTTDGCSSGGGEGKGGCYNYTAYADKCDDGTVCTTGDLCDQNAVCVGTNVCDDGISCTADSCTVVGGKPTCANTAMPKYSACDDGNACTSNDQCDSNTNCGGVPVNCDDNNSCTSEACDKAYGCAYTNLGWNSCTSSGQCSPGGACLNGYCWVPCDDGNACTNSENCYSGACQASGIAGAKYCGGGATCASGSTCVNGYCTPGCDDGNLCTLADMCTGGTCAGTQNSCNDNDACTIDSCNNVSGGCVHSALCDDGNPCTTDSCNNGNCAHVNVATGVACGSANYCKAGTCTTCPNGTIGVTVDSTNMVCAWDYPAWGIQTMAPNQISVANSVVTDNFTGLMWHQGTYASSQGTYVQSTCDGATFGSYNDWRAPTIAELQTITDYFAVTSPALNSLWQGTNSGSMWSIVNSTTSGQQYAYYANDGHVDTLASSSSVPLRCVRGVANVPSALMNGGTRFVTSNDSSTTYDAATTLMWKRINDTATYTQSQAGSHCSQIGAGWHLPSIRELSSLVDRSQVSPRIDPTAFPSTSKASYWTSTPAAQSAGSNWLVDFNSGGSLSATASSAFQARCAFNCDDGNPCTTDGFNVSTAACTHASVADNTLCSGPGGKCLSGGCVAPYSASIRGFDDGGVPRQTVAFDYPVWGNRAISPSGSSFSSPGDGTVVDSGTGLVWQKVDSGSPTTSVAAASSYCDSLYLGFKADWRLPSVAELESLVDYSASSPYINSNFGNTGASSYWTFVTDNYVTSSTFVLNFGSGQISYVNTSSGSARTRCVRGAFSGTLATNRYGTPVSGTVLDNATNLVWQTSAQGSVGSAAAATNCNTNTAALPGSGWRMPNVRELFSITYRTPGSVPPIDTSVFFGTNTSTFWTATPYQNSGTQNWYFDFNFSGTDAGQLTTNNSKYRCVRTGP